MKLKLLAASLLSVFALTSASYADTVFYNGSIATTDPTTHVTGQSTSGTAIGVWPTTPIAVIKPVPINFTVGLFVVLTATTLSGNITIVYQ